MVISEQEVTARHNRISKLIPAGCHTYSKGDDQFPSNAPKFIERGEGAIVWDPSGKKFVDWGMGLRAVMLGHCYPKVVEAVKAALGKGSNFTRPHLIELELAEKLNSLIPSAEMVKFAKNGSDVTTAAVKLARAHTTRDLILFCKEHPFFSVNDWFIGSTPCDSGIPESIKSMSIPFHYNDPESLKAAFEKHKDRIACVIMESMTYVEPKDNFVKKACDIAHQNGAVFILDEMITGFRFSLTGAQGKLGVTPDLSTFGKAMGNGFSISALVGKSEIMELGGLQHSRERVFLLSTTHGAEVHSYAAALAAINEYEQKDVPSFVSKQGKRLQDGFRKVISENDLAEHMTIGGYPCSPIYNLVDPDGSTSFIKKTIFAQEMARKGFIMPYLAPSYSHSDQIVDSTIAAFSGIAGKLCDMFSSPDPSKYVEGEVLKPVFRKFNKYP